jgi:hypothetical protein
VLTASSRNRTIRTASRRVHTFVLARDNFLHRREKVVSHMPLSATSESAPATSARTARRDLAGSFRLAPPTAGNGTACGHAGSSGGDVFGRVAVAVDSVQRAVPRRAQLLVGRHADLPGGRSQEPRPDRPPGPLGRLRTATGAVPPFGVFVPPCWSARHVFGKDAAL